MSDRDREADENSDELVKRFNLDGRREPDTLTRHISDQIDALFRETELLRQPAYSFATELQRRVDWVLKQGGGGGRDVMGAGAVPDEYDMRDPAGHEIVRKRAMEAATPRLVWALKPDLEVIPNLEGRISRGLIDFIRGIAAVTPPASCQWHWGEGGHGHSLLPFPHGQYVVIFIVCAECRAKLDAKYPDGLRWFPEEGS